MKPENTTSRKMMITGWVLSALAILFLLMDGIMKLMKPDVVIQTTKELGYPESSILPIGVCILLSVIIHLIPRFTFIGAILITACLGGAVATHIRLQNPLFSHILFPVYLGIMIWGGLYLRNSQFRKLVAF
jgi:hypothetical protein